MPAQSSNRSASLTIRTTPELKTKLERLADQDGRTLSNYIERALEQHAEQAGKRR